VLKPFVINFKFVSLPLTNAGIDFNQFPNCNACSLSSYPKVSDHLIGDHLSTGTRCNQQLNLIPWYASCCIFDRGLLPILVHKNLNF
jgi:hypothetical protein